MINPPLKTVVSGQWSVFSSFEGMIETEVTDSPENKIRSRGQESE
jgi:hypothetical protein